MTDDDVRGALRMALDGGADRRAAIATVVADLHVAKRRVYDIAAHPPPLTGRAELACPSSPSTPRTGPSAAFFDLDRTLISGSSVFVFGVAAWRAGLVRRRELLGDARRRRRCSASAAPTTTPPPASATGSSARSRASTTTTSSR